MRMSPLEYAFALHADVFEKTRGRYLHPGHNALWREVADAYEVAADALHERGDLKRGQSANRWASTVAAAIAQSRAPRPKRCPRWRLHRHGRIRGPGEAELWHFLQGRIDPYLDGWHLFDTDRGLEINRDDEANLLPSDDQAVLVGSAALAALTGCDRVRWR